MAEKTMLVCDTCGDPANETVLIKTSLGNRQRDYCGKHFTELIAGSRVPKRGRKLGWVSPSKSTARKPTRKAGVASKRTTAAGRGKRKP